MANLTDRAARNLAPNDNPLADGTVTGLYLYPSPKKKSDPKSQKGNGKWKLRYMSPETGKRRDMGLGTYPSVSIAEARDAGIDARKQLASGIDPLAERDRVAANQASQASAQKYTFEVAAREVYETLKPSWENPKHAAQWITTLETYVFPTIGSAPVEALQPKDFAKVLQPIWLGKVETAGRVKQRCHMSAISAHGTVLRDCVVECLRFIFTRIGVEDDEEPKDGASETRDDEGACRAGR